MSVEVGSITKGTVVKIADYGVIVRLAGGKTGLIHISEIADSYVRDVRDYFSENDQVTVKVLRLNNKGRYELSAKQTGMKLLPRSEREEVGRPASDRALEEHSLVRSPAAARPAATFEDRLSKFLKDSEERQSDLKRNIESKRGRR